MKTSARNIFFLDRIFLILIIGCLLAAAATVTAFIYSEKIEKENHELRQQLINIQSLASDVVRLKTIVDSKEKKLTRKQAAGIVSTLESTLKDLGLEARVLKPLDRKKINGYMEENAELEIRNTDLNSIVNLLYRISIAQTPMKIKSASISTTFEDPDKFVLKLLIAGMSRI